MTDIPLPPDNKPGTHNGWILGLIAERRITRAQLNQMVKDGLFRDLHRGLITAALRDAGL